MQIHCRIQAHPSRASLRPALLKSLAPLATQIVEHSSDPPNPWEGYRLCLSDLPECSHVLVIQDDALPCRNFPAALEQIADRHLDVPVVLFLSSLPGSTAAKARHAMKANERYTPLLAAAFVPLVAVLWPRAVAQCFLRWASIPRRGITRADDHNAARFAMATKQPFMVTCPSLVEHNDYIESVKGGRPATWGGDRGRVALFLAEDGLHYDWS